MGERPRPRPRFTLAVTGDLLHTRRLAPIAEDDERFAQVVARLRAADATFGNLELTVAERDDPEAWIWSVTEDWALGSEPHVIEDLRDLGFDIVGRANNHAMDRGPAGLRTTSRLLDDAAIVHAGAGEDRSQAAAPRFLETPRGRVGVVSVTTSPSPRDVAPALDAFAGLAPRPGIHTLGLQPVVTVPNATHEVLRQLHDRMPDSVGEWMSGEPLNLFRTRFVAGAELAIEYLPDTAHRDAIMRSLRQSAAQADVTILAVHAHQGDDDPANPLQYLRDLAHDGVAAGADVVAVSGPHVPAPIEIHDGAAILYGLSNFIWSDVGGPLPEYIWQLTRSAAGEHIDPRTMSEAELIDLLNEDAFADPWIFRAAFAEVVFGEQGVEEVRVHPVDLGSSLPLTRKGIPRTPEAEVAREICERFADISSTLGTKLDVADGTATITLG
jgi:poly-gamma-glutamate capsule biosynthesis protein CapA/YwtB (metallophosphatase superfamily)